MTLAPTGFSRAFFNSGSTRDLLNFPGSVSSPNPLAACRVLVFSAMNARLRGRRKGWGKNVQKILKKS
jgi:hypothetical protein